MARKVMVMDIDDQFAFADRVADILASFGIELNDYQMDVLFEEIMDVTDPYSVGATYDYGDNDNDEDA